MRSDPRLDAPEVLQYVMVHAVERDRICQAADCEEVVLGSAVMEGIC